MKPEVALGALLATALWAVVALFFSSSSIPFLKDFAAPSAAVLAAATMVAWVAYRVGQARASVAKAAATTIDEAIARFESRSKQLVAQAWLFLILVLLLLGAGALAVIYAQNLTASDIGAPTLDAKLSAINKDQERVEKRIDEIERGPKRDCRAELESALKRPVTHSTSLPIVDLTVREPVGDLVIQRIEQAFADRPGVAGITFTVEIAGCQTSWFELLRADVENFKGAIRGQTLLSESTIGALREGESLVQRRQVLKQVSEQINLQKVETEIGTSKSTTPAPNPENELFLRLLQTSVTRFGLLAVIGFFVSILVSLYRYNIRLAAFYTVNRRSTGTP
ncbi:hypothetical protein IVB43_15895 [Bradyrhizobium sp. 48]|uniref:hypothetical protein n=1 Tax=Bradyrhizobium sp. 48 TaxID=2782676 RepID=UPI001FF8EBAF|nr:hypothetical protein [Bradyrhizobium sp. 48]MCK1443871.1 hypothetical protein [Bradyrhizobium sp. 48]